MGPMGGTFWADLGGGGVGVEHLIFDSILYPFFVVFLTQIGAPKRAIWGGKIER